MVEVRALGEPAGGTVLAREAVEPAPVSSGGFSIISEAAAATPNIYDRPMRRVYAQVGAFGEHDNALRLMGRLKAGGYDAVFVVSETGSLGDLHRVRIGPLADLDAYDELVEGLSTFGLTESRLIVEQ